MKQKEETFGKTASEWLAVLDRMRTRAIKGIGVLSSPIDTSVGNTPADIVYEEDMMRLMRYVPMVDDPLPVPVLIVYALVNRHYMLDLQPGRSAVRNLLASGLDVYIIDWGYPRKYDRYITLNDYISGYLHNSVEVVKKRSGQSQITLMGVCQGGTFSVIYSSLFPENIKNLVTLVSPIDFDTDDGLLHVWARYLDVDNIVDTFGNIPGDFMNIGFLLLNPFRLMFAKYVDFLENVDDKDFVSNFIRMEKWIFDSPDQAGETWRQFMKDFYQSNKLVRGELELNGKRVDLRRIEMPLLNVFAERDHLVPPASSRPLTDLVSSRDKQVISFPTGHIGLFVGRRAQEEIWPLIAKWVVSRSQPDSSRPGSRQKRTVTVQGRSRSTPKQTH